MASIIEHKNFGYKQAIHVSISSVRSYQPHLTDREAANYALEVAPEVIKTFFGGRLFVKGQDEENKPFNKHYLSFLEAHE